MAAILWQIIMQYNIEQLKSAYDKHRNLKLAANELGVKWQTLYWHLKKANHHIVGDKSKYGSATDKFAAKAEQEFLEMVPSAIYMNTRKYQCKYDFEINGLKVDVKASNLKNMSHTSQSKRWMFSIKKQELIADFIIGMAYTNSNLNRMFLFPRESIRYRSTISIPEHGSKWDAYEVSKEDLIYFFEKTIKH